jgi:hypothetical protein
MGSLVFSWAERKVLKVSKAIRVMRIFFIWIGF